MDLTGFKIILILTFLDFSFLKFAFKLLILFLFDHFPFLKSLVKWINSVVVHVFLSFIIFIVLLTRFWFESLTPFGFFYFLSHIVLCDHRTLVIGVKQKSLMRIFFIWRIFIRIRISIVYPCSKCVDFKLVKLNLPFKIFDDWDDFRDFFFNSADKRAESDVINEIPW